jgi:hypothetical protein
MISWLVALILGAAFAVIQYRFGGAPKHYRLQALRGVAVTAAVALLLNAPVGCSRSVRPYAALDASSSWRVAGDTGVWRRAVQAADSIGADTTLLVGDSVRAGDPPSAPTDDASQVGALVERALGAGRPVTLITDGRVSDPERLQELPSGSSVILLEGATRRDAALASLSVPPAAVTGDSIDISAVVAAGSGGAAAGRVELAIDGASYGTQTVDSMSPFAEREVRWRLSAGANAGQRLVRVVVTVPGDVLARNDTLHAGLEVAAGASAVFASTAPDFDARYALEVLRGTLAVPTRGYYRVAPGEWRVDGSLAPVSEDEVRRNLGEAPIVVLHGDTAAFGPPRVYVRGSLALVAPPASRGEEYYPTSAPPSPLMATFGALPWDSLPPIEVGEAPRDVEWTALAARRGRRLDERRVVVGSATPRRTVIVSAAGLWRWRFKGGRAGDTFVSLWGSVFDWLAGETVDMRGARPVSAWVRVGEPIRWRRGGMKDSLATIVARRRGGTTADTIRLRFAGASTIAESAPLPAGIYNTSLAGNAGLLVVNESAEWVPHRPTVRAGAIGSGAAAGRAPRSRAAWWIYAIALTALCTEWVLRRRIGLR